MTTWRRNEMLQDLKLRKSGLATRIRYLLLSAGPLAAPPSMCFAALGLHVN